MITKPMTPVMSYHEDAHHQFLRPDLPHYYGHQELMAKGNEALSESVCYELQKLDNPTYGLYKKMMQRKGCT